MAEGAIESSRAPIALLIANLYAALGDASRADPDLYMPRRSDDGQSARAKPSEVSGLMDALGRCSS